MKIAYPLKEIGLLALCLAVFALTACGQQDQSMTESADEGAASEAQASVKVPITTSSDEARALYIQGRSLLDNLHFVEASEVFTSAVEADPDFAMGYFMLAATAQTAAQLFRAVRQAQYLAANVTDGEQLYIDALVAGSENDQAGQLVALNKLLAMYPQDERTHMQLANYYNGQQDFGEAVKHFSHATTINPEFANAFNSLGYAHRSNDNLDGAKEAFARYVDLIPDEANPYDSYAELLLEMGEYDQSIENYRKTLEIDPNFPSAYAGITINQSLKGDAEAAQATAAEMLAVARNSVEKQGAIFQSVTSHLFANNVEAAIAASEEMYAVAEIDGDHAAMGGIREYMGDIMLVSENAAKGMEYYDSALSHRQMADINDANKAQAGRTHLYKSAIAAMINEDMQIARSRASEYYAAAEADGTAFERRRIHELAGYLAEDSETSVNELSQANQLDPIVLYWFAVAQKDLGNKGQAIDLATRAANRNTLSPNLPFFRDEALELLNELGIN